MSSSETESSDDSIVNSDDENFIEENDQNNSMIDYFGEQDQNRKLPLESVKTSQKADFKKPVYENQVYMAEVMIKRMEAAFKRLNVDFNKFKSVDFQVNH